MFPVYAPEASDNAGLPAGETKQQSVTSAAWKETLSGLLSKFRQANNTQEAVRTLNEAGRLQLVWSSTQDALATFQQSYELLDQNINSVTRADTLNGLAAAYVGLNDCLHAQPLIDEARTISGQNNYPAGKAEALLLLAECQNNNESHSVALGTASEALPIFQSLGNNQGVVRAHIAVGNYHYALSSLTEAEQDFQAALDLARQMNDSILQAESLVYLGFIPYRKGAWQETFGFLTRAQDLLGSQEPPNLMGRIAATFAESFIEAGLPEVGLQKYQQALEYYRLGGTPANLISMSWGIGRAQFFQQKYAEALIIFQQLLAEAEAKDVTNWNAQCHDYLGRTYAGMNDSEQALAHLETALTIYEKLNNPLEAARVRALIGQLYQTQGKLDEALPYYQRALQTFDALTVRIDQSATLYAMGQLEMKRGNYKTAEDLLRQSIETTENVRSLSTSSDLTAAFSATVHDRYLQYIQCLMQRNDKQAAIQAFETSESARARSLAEFLRRTETNLLANVDPELAKQEKSLRQLLQLRENDKIEMLAGEYNKEELDKLNQEMAQLEEQYKSVSATISQRYPAYAQITRPRGWDLARIQEQVVNDDDTVLLEYMVGTDKSYVWTVTRNSFDSHEIPGAAINETAESVYKLLKDPVKPENESELNNAVRRLAQMTLAPIAGQLNKRRIIVIADGALNYIPFQILPSPSSDTELLVAGHDIINAPSASVLGELREEAAGRGVRSKVLAAFGNPTLARRKTAPAENSPHYALRDIELEGDDFDPSAIDELFFAEREIAYLRDIASPDKTFAVTRYDATRDQLFSMDISQYAILHFATHGLLNPKHPERSALVLSTVDPQGNERKGLIRLQDVYSLRAPVDLVVLSACRTGLGKDIRGEGLVGLTRGFMYAGATTVVASLWKVDDEATSELMKTFYTEMLQNHKTPDEALRIAQNSIRERPGWSAPHYWAGFTLQGEYRYVVNSERGWRRYSTLIVIGGILGIVLLSVAGWRFASKVRRERQRREI